MSSTGNMPETDAPLYYKFLVCFTKVSVESTAHGDQSDIDEVAIMNTDIVLIPIGAVQPGLLIWLESRLTELTGRKLAIGEAVPLPAAGYDTRRLQYRGDALLDVLRTLRYTGVQRLVGLTNVDCYAPRLNFIFGQAMIGGQVAFVALPRLRQSFYGLPEDTSIFRERALKEVVHEMGHTWRLSHCTDPRCVMHFSNSLQDTDVKGMYFCPRCLNRLDEAGP